MSKGNINTEVVKSNTPTKGLRNRCHYLNLYNL